MRPGYVARVDIHPPDPEGDDRNIHMHVWATLRKIGPDGFARTKGEQQERYRNRHEYVEELRHRWERLPNRHLERAGIDARIDMRSLKEQGIDREPEQHRGPTVTAIERENRASTVVVEIDQWRKDIAEERALLAEDRQLAAAEKQIEAQIIDLQAKRAEREARDAARGQVEDIRPLNPGDEKSRRDAAADVGEVYRQYVAGFDAPERAPETVQGQYAGAAPSDHGQPAPRAMEPENAAKGDEAQQPVGFFGRIVTWFENWWRPTSPVAAARTDDEQRAQQHDKEAVREWQAENIKSAEPEKDLRLQQSFAERFGTPPGRDLGPSDEEITKARKIESATAEPEITDAKAAKLAALARHRAEIEQSIEKRERDPDRGYERD